MEKTLSTILQEGADKINAKSSVVFLPSENNSICVKRILESKEHGYYEEVTTCSNNKKNAQQLAAGKLLLQMLDKPCWRSFPFKFESVEEVRSAIEKEIECLTKSDNNAILASNNPVQDLQVLCAKKGLPNPLEEFFETSDKQFIFKYTIGTIEASGTATTKKQAKANAARNMIQAIIDNDNLAYRESKKQVKEDVKLKASPAEQQTQSITKKKNESQAAVVEDMSMQQDDCSSVLSPTKAKVDLRTTSKTAKKEMSKEEILTYIEEAINTVAEDTCIKSVKYLKDMGILQKIFNERVAIHYNSHQSYDPSKKLKTSHIVREEAFKRFNNKLCKDTVMHSFIGIDETEQFAENQAARNLLSFVKNFYKLQVVD